MKATNAELAELMVAIRHEGEWWAPRVPLETALAEMMGRAQRGVVDVLRFPRFQGVSVRDEQWRLLVAIYAHNHLRALVPRFSDAASCVEPEPTETITFTVPHSPRYPVAVHMCPAHTQPCLACIGARGLPHPDAHRCCLC